MPGPNPATAGYGLPSAERLKNGILYAKAFKKLHLSVVGCKATRAQGRPGRLRNQASPAKKCLLSL